MDFKALSVKEAYPFYKSLYKEVKRDYFSFNGLDFFNLRLFKGDFLLLKNRFDSKVYGLFEKGVPKILATHYQAKDSTLGIANSLGSILVNSSVSQSEITTFVSNLKIHLKDIDGPIYAPINAHFNLGFTLPNPSIDSTKLTFLTSASSEGLEKLFYNNDGFKQERKFYSLSFKVADCPEYVEKIKSGLSERPPEYTVEKLSLTNYKQDIRDYNRIINESFKDHWNFFPLSFEEEWDLMKTAILVLKRDYVRFLVHKNTKVALNMFMPDFHQVFTNGDDTKNMMRSMFYKKAPKRVRGVTTCIIPEYRGKGLLKYVRNENLLGIFADGVLEVESSYIDQDNINSLENSKSTGAKYSHEFNLFSLN
ncbi:hypothetical protein A9Q84_16240 [Halobacteriovorax marinus]|uniref:N-acetyltransferase domain-containing protein n=1 Tax=Halobacteriovorax marinus TaxID=97084 RepID=A0A1Y5F4I7_9BACT|nr:hypothetical protein A9Q84_16240 [Halobacteriovorax marinus]